MTHVLDARPEYFQPVLDGIKRFEFRSGLGHSFFVGDQLVLREWDPDTRQYTGRELLTSITYIQAVLETYSILGLGDVTA
jgi:hypothetical protein